MQVSLQDLHNAGLNPFAAKLLVESYQGKTLPVAFELGGVIVTVGLDPRPLIDAVRTIAALKHDETAHEAGEWLKLCPRCVADAAWHPLAKVLAELDARRRSEREAST